MIRRQDQGEGRVIPSWGSWGSIHH